MPMSQPPQFIPYFAYGSNLLADRLHCNVPSARRVAPGRLPDFRLDFTTYVRSWRGAVATITPKPGGSVWGAVWEIERREVAHLDGQEGVEHGFYYPLEVVVLMGDGRKMKCRTYRQRKEIEGELGLGEIPAERRPSRRYLETMVRGAEETGLPGEYVEGLRRIPCNDFGE